MSVAVLRRGLRDGWRGLTIAVAAVGAMLVLGLVVWYGGVFAWQEYQWESESPGLGLPNWWYVVWLPLLALAVAWRLTQMTLDRLRGRLKDES